MLSSCIRTHARLPLLRNASLIRWSRAYTSNIEDPPHSNPLGIQLLPLTVHSQLFPPSKPPPPDLVSLSKSHLSRHNLLTKQPSSVPPISLDLPALAGKTLDEHFYKLGMEASSPYLRYANEFTTIDLQPPPVTEKWVRQSGWTKYYADGRIEAVAAPEEECLVFDVEVLYKISPFAVMACAASPNAWYAWLSPWVLGETEDDRQLIPLGDPGNARIVVGHNVGYDRSRVKEEYNIVQTASMYLDTMSLHAATNGMAAKQRTAWAAKKRNRLATYGEQEKDDGSWVGQSSFNSLKDVALFHCGIEVDKTIRDQFGILDPAGVREQLNMLISYCAEDVAITHKVYQAVLPVFLKVCPHPVSFAALRHVSSAILPVNSEWKAYIANAEATYHHLSDGVQARLINLAEEALTLKDKPEIYTNDPWLRQLNWSGQEVKFKKGDDSDSPTLLLGQKKPGSPKWYKSLFPKSDSPMSLTVRTKITPLLLRMSWDGYPLVWSDVYGWTFRVSKRPGEEDSDLDAIVKRYQGTSIECSMTAESNPEIQNDTEGFYFKLPHKDGPGTRCVSPLAKAYQRYFDAGILKSEYALAKEALEMNAKCAYWLLSRERIMGQNVVWQGDTDFGLAPTEGNPEVGIILPIIVPMGTVTRRAVESTWLAAPPANPHRVGSEIKAMVTPPPGYVFVGADVDSEELWIASLVGDAAFGFHGGNALGFMNLEGTKAERTDVHSKTADMLGITRDGAKIVNYSRIYGAGASFAAVMLRQLNPRINPAQASFIVDEMYRETKGRRTSQKIIHERSFWHGGTESFIFNKLESFAEQEKPRTPALGAGITMALMKRYLSPGEFMPSRINWVMQSSGVDYLHLLIVAMDYLTRRYNIAARVAITVHDDVRYLCKEEDKYRCAMALQVANIWTRAMFSQQMGINDLPQSVAYFSAVDIDHVLRKEVNMPCVTPSHSDPIPHGESLDIVVLLAKGAKANLDPEVTPKGGEINLEKWTYTPREPVIDEYRAEDTMAYLEAQIVRKGNELDEIMEERQKELFGEKVVKSTREMRKEARKEAMMAKKLGKVVKKSKQELRQGIAEKREIRAKRKLMKEKISQVEEKIKQTEEVLGDLRAQVTGEENKPKETVDKKVVKEKVVKQSTQEINHRRQRMKSLKVKMRQVREAGMSQEELKEMTEIKEEQERLKETRIRRKKEKQLLMQEKRRLRAEKRAKIKAKAAVNVKDRPS